MKLTKTNFPERKVNFKFLVTESMNEKRDAGL